MALGGGWLVFCGISTLVSNLMPNPLYTSMSWLIGCYGIATFGAYLMPNSVYTYIKPKISR